MNTWERIRAWFSRGRVEVQLFTPDMLTDEWLRNAQQHLPRSDDGPLIYLSPEAGLALVEEVIRLRAEPKHG